MPDSAEPLPSEDPPPSSVEVELDEEDSDNVHLTEFLETALLSGTLSAPSLLALSDEHLIQYSLLIMSLLARLGSTASASTESTQALESSEFESLLDAFCLRISSSRVLKLRAGLLTGVTDLGMAEAWKPAVTFDPRCYDHAQEQQEQLQNHHLRTSASVGGLSTATVASNASVAAQGLLDDPTELSRYVSRVFFHPQNGISLKTKRRNLVQTYPNAFSEKLAVLFLVQDLHCDTKTAQLIGQAMLEKGLIKQVYGGGVLLRRPSSILHAASASLHSTISDGTTSGGRDSTNSSSGKSRNSTSTTKFGHGDGIFVRAMSKQLSVRASLKAASTTDANNNDGVNLTLGLDSIDLQSIKFWRTSLWEKAPFQEGTNLDAVTVVHPMATSVPESEYADVPVQQASDWAIVPERHDHDRYNDHGGCLIQNVHVAKVFASMAKPAFLSLAAYQPGKLIAPESLVEIGPRVIAKQGDNLLNDASVELLFRIFSHVWKMDAQRFLDRVDCQPPFAFDYDVLPCGHRIGLLGVLPGLEPLNDFDWTTWATKYKDSPQVLDIMCRSAAGCSIATFILGCGDRHWDNIQIQHDTTMLHIDFGMILGENPAFKTPRFSISAGQEAAFRQVGIWDRFVTLCGVAFLSLRARAPELINVAALLLQKAGRPQSKILKYLASRESFHLEEQDETKAEAIVMKQVRQSSTHWETIARKFTHDRIDPLFFKAVERAPASLVAAVEKMYDKT